MANTPDMNRNQSQQDRDQASQKPGYKNDPKLSAEENRKNEASRNANRSSSSDE